MKKQMLVVLVVVLAMAVISVQAGLITTGTYTYQQAPDGHLNTDKLFGGGDAAGAGPYDFSAGNLTDGIKEDPGVGLPERETFQVLWLASSNSNSQWPGQFEFTINFDLGTNKSLDKINLSSNPRPWWGVHDAEILYKAEGDSSYTSLGKKWWYGQANVHATGYTLYEFLEDPAQAFTARYVQVKLYRRATTMNMPLSEVEIFEVPEPATIGLLSVGLLGLFRKKA